MAGPSSNSHIPKNLIIAFLFALIVFDVGSALIITKTEDDIFRETYRDVNRAVKTKNMNAAALGGGVLVVSFLLYNWLQKNEGQDP